MLSPWMRAAALALAVTTIRASTDSPTTSEEANPAECYIPEEGVGYIKEETDCQLPFYFISRDGSTTKFDYAPTIAEAKPGLINGLKYVQKGDTIQRWCPPEGLKVYNTRGKEAHKKKWGVALCLNPAALPTFAPTEMPTISPTSPPTDTPTRSPTQQPTRTPTRSPTTPSPSVSPTTPIPSRSPTRSPTRSPSMSPSMKPTRAPTTPAPSEAPSVRPTRSPTQNPSKAPTLTPTTSQPTVQPTKTPTEAPTLEPTQAPITRDTHLVDIFCQSKNSAKLCEKKALWNGKCKFIGGLCRAAILFELEVHHDGGASPEEEPTGEKPRDSSSNYAEGASAEDAPGNQLLYVGIAGVSGFGVLVFGAAYYFVGGTPKKKDQDSAHPSPALAVRAQSYGLNFLDDGPEDVDTEYHQSSNPPYSQFQSRHWPPRPPGL